MRKVLIGAFFSLWSIFILITVPPIGLIIFLAFVIASPRVVNFLRKIKVCTRRMIRTAVKKGTNSAISKFRQPKVIVIAAILIFMIIVELYFLFSHLMIKETNSFLWYMFKQIVLTGLLLFSILALAWISFSLDRLFDSFFVKIAASASISACILISRLLAIEFLSENFPFPPSYMPTSFGIATIILAFTFTSLIFSLLALFFEIGMLLTLSKRSFKKYRLIMMFMVILFFTGFVGAYTASIAVVQGISLKGQLLIIKMAEKYDFTSNHLCKTEDGESILFIDGIVDRAIAATFPKNKEIFTKNISDKYLKNNMPTNFHMVRCNPLPSTVN